MICDEGHVSESDAEDAECESRVLEDCGVEERVCSDGFPNAEEDKADDAQEEHEEDFVRAPATFRGFSVGMLIYDLMRSNGRGGYVNAADTRAIPRIVSAVPR